MKRLLLLLLLCSAAFGQGTRVDIPPIVGGTGRPVPNVQVTVCTATAIGLPCSPQVLTYTDATLTTACSAGFQVVLTGTSTCQATTDSLGNGGFWVPPGKYKYTLTGPNLTGQTYTVVAPCDPSNCTITALTAGSVNGDLWVGTGSGQFANIGACITAAVAGQSCHLPANGSETLAANITLKNQVCIVTHGLYTVTMGTFSIIGPAGVPPCIKSFGLASSTSAGPGANLNLVYTGTGAALDIGTAVSDTRGGNLEGIFINLTGGGANSIGVRERRFQAAYHNNVVVSGGGANAATEIGFLLDGTGTFTGNNIYDNCTSNGTLAGMRFIVGNLNKINGGNWSTIVASGIGMDFQNAEGNLVEGVDIESTATAINFANSASVSNNIFWAAFLQSNTTDVVFGAGSKYNIVHNAQAGAMTVTDNSPVANFNMVWGPTLGFRFNSVGQLALAAGSASAPAILLPNNTGIHQTATSQVLGIEAGGFNFFSFGNGKFGLRSNAFQCWAASGDSDTACDIGTSRGAAGVMTVDTTAAGNALGTIKPAALLSGGAAAGTTGTGACATITTNVGGSLAGSFKCTGTTGAATVTITPGTTATNGWICTAYDETTRANLLQQTGHNGTTCTLTATSVTQNDVFVFSAIAF